MPRLAATTSAVAATFAVAVPSAPAVPPGSLRPADARGPLGTERLSDERQLTRWAHPLAQAGIRREPDPSAPTFARLRMYTEDGFPEVYLALRSYVDEHGRTWIKIRVPMRPNHRRGWVPRDALGRLRIVRTRLVVDRRALRATLRRRGGVVWRARIGVGGPSTPTPGGDFYIRERIRVAEPGGLYGPWAFGTSAYSALSDWPGGGVIGIHGTNQPHLIPGRPSHGCIRVRNRAIRRLAKLLPIGTPVRIR